MSWASLYMLACGIHLMKHITIQTDLKNCSIQTGKIKNRSVIMAKHIIDKDNTLKALESINTLLSQSLQIIKKVNEDEQWDFCTDDVLARRVNDTERLIKEISDVVFRNKKAK